MADLGSTVAVLGSMRRVAVLGPIVVVLGSGYMVIVSEYRVAVLE